MINEIHISPDKCYDCKKKYVNDLSKDLYPYKFDLCGHSFCYTCI